MGGQIDGYTWDWEDDEGMLVTNQSRLEDFEPKQQPTLVVRAPDGKDDLRMDFSMPLDLATIRQRLSDFMGPENAEKVIQEERLEKKPE